MFLHPILWSDKTSCINNVKLHKPQPDHSNPVSDSLAVSSCEMLMVLSSSMWVISSLTFQVQSLNWMLSRFREMLISSLRDCSQVSSLEKWQLNPNLLNHSLSKAQIFHLSHWTFLIFHHQDTNRVALSRNCDYPIKRLLFVCAWLFLLN